MPYKYSKTQNARPKDGAFYFLDANIWIKILAPKSKPSFKDKNYITFVEKIQDNSKCKIVVTALVLSEVINRILRDVHMEKFLLKMQKQDPNYTPPKDFYKAVFRKSNDFKIAYTLLCDEIRDMHDTLHLVSDELGEKFKLKHILKDLPIHLDFNDHYYYQICKANNYILVTDDKDFWVEDVEVMTESDTLFNRFLQLNIPK
ncbi:PIN domain-containing protein [Empedobacter stercoris]|uniref:PIN domain-containing protein n=1 Tax=Empedobacter stercoris TaxID=1628248 RepID=UPI001CE20493|nr:PIN domain-containing protein [Empedobacter stercoris]MCA4782741.1 PIN domain-containing protein [Empedobacter stercoris]